MDGAGDFFDLGMAKKRDHKIMITDEAIEKVPLVKYKDIPEEVYPILQELAKEVLRVSKEENDSNEVALTFSLEYLDLIREGREYFGIALGDDHSVDPRLNAVAGHLIMASTGCVVIVLHNHPSLSKFSLDDVQFFLRNETVKMMVVITNLGAISYLTKSKKYDYGESVKLYNESVNIHNEGSGLRDYQKAVEWFLSNSHKVGIIYDDR